MTNFLKKYDLRNVGFPQSRETNLNYTLQFAPLADLWLIQNYNTWATNCHKVEVRLLLPKSFDLPQGALIKIKTNSLNQLRQRRVGNKKGIGCGALLISHFLKTEIQMKRK